MLRLKTKHSKYKLNYKLKTGAIIATMHCYVQVFLDKCSYEKNTHQ